MLETLIDAGMQFATTILGCAVSVWVALHMYKKELKQSNQEKTEIKEANTANVISFIDFACASLFYLSPGPKVIDCQVKEAIVELEKISIVNGTLSEIKSCDVTKEFISDYQSCKIILRILEVELRSALEELCGDIYKSDYFSKIDIVRRTEMLESVVKKFSKYIDRI